MKKLLITLLTVFMVFSMVGCSQKPAEDDGKTLDGLVISFVPSKDADEIMTAAEPLKELLANKLAEKGYTIDPATITINVGTNYNAVGEGLTTGSIDLGFIPAGTYVLYHDDGAELLVKALRYGITNEEGTVLDPALGIEPWNIGETKQSDTELVTGYASLIYVNIDTEKGADLYAKANAGTLTWEDVNDASWYVCSTTSSAGYIYPSIWLNQNFGEGVGASKKTVASLSSVIPDGSYSAMIPQLIAGNVDVTVSFADYRYNKDAKEYFASAYEKEIAEGKYSSIYDIIKVIGVSEYIMNDTISYSSKSEKMTPELVKALQESFIEIGQTEEGRACVKPYSHEGYTLGADSDYDAARAANSIFAK